MIRRPPPTIVVLALAFLGPTTVAFESGSNGSYGAMNITADTTLDLPPDGICHCTTIAIAAGATLRFNPNALNTPVYLLATGDVVINGTIDVSGFGPNGIVPGRGGPGGFNGGAGGAGIEPTEPGDGEGPGGGRGNTRYGSASFSAAGSDERPSPSYGNALLVPLVGGSGSAGYPGGSGAGEGGGGGGGAICVSSSSRVRVSGAIRADGGGGSTIYTGSIRGAGGSGGAIRLVSTVVDGGGVLSVLSGETAPGVRNSSSGRIRIDSEVRLQHRYLYFQGPATYGSQMFVFPSRIPKLNIVEAAGRSIPVGGTSAVRIDLPAGSPSSQLVRIEAKDFTNAVVALEVVIMPENGPSTTYPAQIKTSDSPPQVSVDVAIPAGIPTRIFAWTRPTPSAARP